MELQTIRTAVGNGGWVAFEGGDFPAGTYARFGLGERDRLEVRELYLAPDGRLDAAALRRLPLVTMEALASDPELRRAIVARLELPGPDLKRLAAHFASSFGPRGGHWVARSMRAQLPGSGEPQAPMPHRKRWRPRTVQAPPLRFEIPSTVPYPDDFYRQVADAYRWLAVTSPRPAVVLADANRVPETTTRRWVKEARRRGLLAPGQRGRRG
jgi:hypothetical protein